MLAPSAPVAPKIFGPFDGPGALAYRRPMKRWMIGSALGLALTMTLPDGPQQRSATLAVTCPADLDDGSGTGTIDGGVDINDLLFFLNAFEQGAAAADLDDDGLDPATPDNGIDINDLLFYLGHFEAGC